MAFEEGQIVLAVLGAAVAVAGGVAGVATWRAKVEMKAATAKQIKEAAEEQEKALAEHAEAERKARHADKNSMTIVLNAVQMSQYEIKKDLHKLTDDVGDRLDFIEESIMEAWSAGGEVNPEWLKKIEKRRPDLYRHFILRKPRVRDLKLREEDENGG